MTDEPFWMKQHNIINTFIKYAELIIILLVVIILLLLFLGLKMQYWISLIRMIC